MKEAAKSGAVSQIQVLQAQSTAQEMEASVRNSEAELNTARTNLSYCYIRAPFDGRITRATYDIGNYINGAAQPVTLATLYKDDKMFVNFNIEDNQFMKMMITAAQNDSTVKLPETIAVHLGDNGRQNYTGQLDYFSPNVDLSTGTLNVRANLDNKGGELKSGLYVTITLPYSEKTGCRPGTRRLHRHRPAGQISLYRKRFQYRTVPSYRTGTVGRRHLTPGRQRT